MFNLRDLSKVFQGLLMVDIKCITGPEKLVRLWVHENKRVFEDRFINETDHEWFIELMKANVQQFFNLNWDVVVCTGARPPVRPN